MSNLVGCDFECQRNENIQQLRNLYDNELKKYYETYVKYINYKFDTSRNRQYKLNYAESTIKPQVQAINRKLNKILNTLKSNIAETETVINDHERNINNKGNLINKRNNVISKQDTKIEDGNNEILSRNRQVEFTEERNRYRKIMIITLIIVNILLGCGLFYLLKGSK